MECVYGIETFFDYFVETEFDFDNLAAIEDTANSCPVQRGEFRAKTFYAVNKFFARTFGASDSSAEVVNSKEFIEKCIKDYEEHWI